jgi:hypothetical protein
MSETMDTIAECEIMMAELAELKGKSQEESGAPADTVLEQGTYLQGNNNSSYVYCFNDTAIADGYHYLTNMLTGGIWACDDDITNKSGKWVLAKSSRLKVITPAQALELMRKYHKL